jgi:hypothetical protein
MTEKVLSGFNAIQGALSDDVSNHRTPAHYKHIDNAVGHVICNLMHFCKDQQIDFEEQLRYAKHHFFFEK